MATQRNPLTERLPLDALDNTRLNVDPHSAFRTYSPEVIHGEAGDVIVLNATTNYRAMDAAHKASFVSKAKTESAYADLVPDIDQLSGLSVSRFGQEERERIIRSGDIPEVMPFMAGVRIAWAERRARAQHEKAQSALRGAANHRLTRVANHVAKGIVNGTSYSDPEDPLRPRTLLEKKYARRMHRLFDRANDHNTDANIVEDAWLPEHEVAPIKTEDLRPIEPEDFMRNSENLSIFEKGQRRSARHHHNLRRERSNRLIHGFRVPGVNKRIGLISFDSLAVGGPGAPARQAMRALEKRDKAVRKAEALRRATGVGTYVGPAESPIPEKALISTSAGQERVAAAHKTLKQRHDEAKLVELSARQENVYGQALEGREDLKDVLDGILVSLYQRELDKFKAGHNRAPGPVEEAHLKLQATNETYREATRT